MFELMFIASISEKHPNIKNVKRTISVSLCLLVGRKILSSYGTKSEIV